MSALSFYEYFQTELTVKENQLLAEKLKKENAIAHYKLLKAQIEPHFLFNSLSVLSSLVYKDADLASDFILKLSRILRFSIDRNDQMYVSLEEELDFVNNYFFLIHTRFGDAIRLTNHLEIREHVIVPPGTLQVLTENSIKHNSHNKTHPLEIRLYNDQDFIYVSNNLNPGKPSHASTGVGLINLSKRFYLLCGKNIDYGVVAGDFVVKLPIIFKNNSDENIGH
nr:histidine kinase [Sinomicrobium weinanense]